MRRLLLTGVILLEAIGARRRLAVYRSQTQTAELAAGCSDAALFDRGSGGVSNPVSVQAAIERVEAAAIVQVIG